MIAGYYSNFEGDIRYDSESISALNMDKITALSSVIHQNVFMFDESIFDNICLHESFTEEELSDALFASGLLEFIEQIPNGKRLYSWRKWFESFRRTKSNELLWQEL